MQPLKTIKLILTFYKSFFLANFIITLGCLRPFWLFGFQSFMAIFWFKTGTLVIIYHFIKTYKNKEFYYYQNLGISKFFLWSATLTFDFTLFIFLIIIAYKFK